MKFYIRLAILAIAVLGVAVVLYRGCGTKVITPTGTPTVVVKPPNIISGGKVTVTERVGDKVKTRRVRVDDADKVTEVVSVGSTHILVLTPKTGFLPDFRAARSRIRVLGGLDSSVVTTLQRPPIFGFTLSPGIGVRYNGETFAPIVGLELLRAGPVRIGASISYDIANSTIGAGPDVGIRLLDNVGVYAGNDFLGNRPYVSLRYRF